MRMDDEKDMGRGERGRSRRKWIRRKERKIRRKKHRDPENTAERRRSVGVEVL